MITRIHLENFKGFKERQTIELKPITLLFGPNSGGKSTVMQAIHYMREILDRKNFDPDRTIAGGEAIDLGGFKRMVYKNDLSLPIILQFDMDIENVDLPDYIEVDEETIEYELFSPRLLFDRFFSGIKTGYVKIELRWNEVLQSPLVMKYETGINDEPVAQIAFERIMANDKLSYKVQEINFGHKLLRVDDSELTEPQHPVSKISLNTENEKSNDMSSEEFLRIEEFESKQVPLLQLRLFQKKQEIGYFQNGFPVLQETAIPFFGKKLPLVLSLESGRDENDLKWEEEIEVVSFLSRTLTGIGELLNTKLQKLVYIGPLRKIPARNYTPPRFSADRSWADGTAAWDLIFKSRESFIKKVNYWLSDRLGCGFSIRVFDSTALRKDESLMSSLMSSSFLDEDSKIQRALVNRHYQKEFTFIDDRNGVECQAMDIGVGISQVFPVVVAALEERFPLVLIEQPELHIHPAIQVNVGDLFISAIQNNDRMIIAETHSEHLILRLLKRIEQTSQNELPADAAPLKPEKVSVMWFEPKAEGVQVTLLPIDKTGEFTTQWPKGFFEERAKELF